MAQPVPTPLLRGIRQQAEAILELAEQKQRHPVGYLGESEEIDTLIARSRMILELVEYLGGERAL